jgi:hypothetical protein
MVLRLGEVGPASSFCTVLRHDPGRFPAQVSAFTEPDYFANGIRRFLRQATWKGSDHLCLPEAFPTDATVIGYLGSKRLRRGSFHSLVALQEAINRFVEEHNRSPRPFVWTADPDTIVEKVRRGYHALASMERTAG